MEGRCKLCDLSKRCKIGMEQRMKTIPSQYSSFVRLYNLKIKIKEQIIRIIIDTRAPSILRYLISIFISRINATGPQLKIDK